MSMDTTALAQKDLGELLGIAELEPNAQEDMLTRIGELVMESAMVRAVSEMTDDEASALSQAVVACNDPAELAKVLQERVPHIDELIAEESEAFRTECIDLLTRVGLAGA
jgi:hypothetical protein